MLTTGKARGPGDTVAQAYEITVPKVQGSQRDTPSMHLSCTTPPRYLIHQATRELRGRGVASGFCWRGRRMLDSIMRGQTSDEIVMDLGPEGLGAAWRARSVTHARIKRERELYAVWLRRAPSRDGGEQFLRWDSEMTAKIAEAGFCRRWRAAA